MENLPKIAVIGAGISGLTCAYELQQAGFDVSVFEKELQVGGRMATRTKGQFPFDIGASHLAESYEEIKRYCLELGVIWQPLEFDNFNVFKDGKIVSLKDIVGFQNGLKLLIHSIGKRKISSFFDLSSASDFDQINAFDFITKYFNQDFAEYLVDPFTSGYQFHDSRELSSGVVKAMLESVRFEGKQWNSLCHMKGEMSALPEALAKRINQLKTGVQVTDMEFLVNQQIAISFSQAKSNQIEKQSFDIIILATTSGAATKIYSQAPAKTKEILKQSKFASTISLAYQIPVDLMPKKAVTWVPKVENQYIASYTSESMKGQPFIHHGKTILSCWLHEDYAKEIMNLSDQEIFQSVKSLLPSVCPFLTDSSSLENYDLQRWPEAMPKFELGHLKRIKSFLENGQGEKNVYICGDYLNSPWTEGALRCGQRLARTIKDKYLH